MAQITATRSELLARRVQLALAEQGRDILKRKRDQLLEEFRRSADLVLAGMGDLGEAAAAALRALAMAEALEGPGAVASAAAVAGRDFPLESTPASIMGVRIADIRHSPVGRPLAGRGYSVAASSAAIDQVAERFESELAMLLDVAIYEMRLRRLVDEIGRTTRRVNALENVVIPRLEDEQAAIQATLDERERQDRFRLKRIATRTSGRHAFATGSAGSGGTA